jgi:homoserine dehydrogenase
MNKINIGIIGFGTVGSGVVKALIEKAPLLKRSIGAEINIKKIADLDITSPRGIKVDKSILTKNVNAVIEDPKIQIVLELIGGIHPAKEYISKAIRQGKHIITANKALLAQEGEEIFNLAEEKGVDVYFEASVCGGIPIIKALREGLIANQIEALFGIINGTSNFILSNMVQRGCEFKEALLEAKRKGFAERNPSLDIEGIDSAHKLAILTFLSFGKFIKLEEIFVEGISHISLADVRYAKELGYVIKLLAIAKREGGELEVRVNPTLIPQEHPLASIGGVINAVYISGDMVGEQLFSGQGAGQMPTASAVLSDLIDLARNIKLGICRRISPIIPTVSIKRLRKIDEIETRYYIRFMAVDRPGVLAKIAGILGKYKISIASVSQKERKRARIVPIVMVTHEAKEKYLRTALSQIDRLPAIKPKSVAIRMEPI